MRNINHGINPKGIDPMSKFILATLITLLLPSMAQTQYSILVADNNHFFIVNQTNRNIGAKGLVARRTIQASHALCLAAGWTYIEVLSRSLDAGEQLSRMVLGFGRKAQATIEVRTFDEEGENRKKCDGTGVTSRVRKKIERELQLLEYTKG